jgi:hypothetical protein
MSPKDNMARLSAWVDPVLLDHARLEARAAGVTFSKFIERAVQQHVSAISAERATIALIESGLRRRLR